MKQGKQCMGDAEAEGGIYAAYPAAVCPELHGGPFPQVLVLELNATVDS